MFLKKLFSETRMPVVVVGSEHSIAEGQYVVTSDESDGSGKLIEALLEKLVELAALEQGKPKSLPQFFLIADDLNGRNRKRIEGCVRVLDEHALKGVEPFAWHSNSVWHPEHPTVRLGSPERYVPALKGKSAGRYIGLRIIDDLMLASGSQGARDKQRDSAGEDSTLPKAVLVAINSEVAEGLAESCVLKNIRVPGDVILAATSGSFRRFGSFLTRSEPDSPAVAEAVAKYLFFTLRSSAHFKAEPPDVFAPRLHLRRSSRNLLHATWRHSPSLTIKRVDNKTRQITCLYGNPVFEHLSGKPYSEARGKTAVELWGQLAGAPIANYDRIAAGLIGDSAPRPILSASWLPYQAPKMCRFTVRFPVKMETRRFGDASLIGSLGFDMSIPDRGSDCQEISLMPLPQYESDSAIEYPDEELLQAFFQSIPATVAIRTGRKIYYMNSTYGRVFFGEEFPDRRSRLVVDSRPDGIGAYFDSLAKDPRNTVSRIGLHRLVRDRQFKKYKSPIPSEMIGDRWVMRFRIADSVFEDGGEASLGFDADLIDGLAGMIEGVDVNQPIENQYVEIVSHSLKGFTVGPNPILALDGLADSPRASSTALG